MDVPRPYAGAAGSRSACVRSWPRRRRDAIRPVEGDLHQSRIALTRLPPGQRQDDPPLAVWAQSFMFAGGSAFLLLAANLFLDYWYLFFLALTPFLYRVIKASPVESLRLGFLLGLSFFGASSSVELMASPVDSLIRLGAGTALFSLFGWAVGSARARWGFNPATVALLWLALQMALVKFGFTGGLLGETSLSHPFMHSLIGLFGFLAVSALVVFFNSLLVLAIVKTLEAARSLDASRQTETRRWNLLFVRNLFVEKVYLVPEERAPPTFLKAAYVTA